MKKFSDQAKYSILLSTGQCILGWPKRSFGFCNALLWENPYESFGQSNIWNRVFSLKDIFTVGLTQKLITWEMMIKQEMFEGEDISAKVSYSIFFRGWMSTSAFFSQTRLLYKVTNLKLSCSVSRKQNFLFVFVFFFGQRD